VCGVTSTSPPPLRGEAELSLEQQVGVLLARRRLIAWLGIVAVLATVLGKSLGPRTFTSESVFLPQSRAGSPVGGLAAQLGLAVATAEGGYSAAFYADLLKSRPMLDSLLATPSDDDGAVSTTAPPLLDRLVPGGPNDRERRLRGVKAMARAVTVSVNQRTGTIRIEMSLRWPGLARGANTRLLELLNQFNVNTRQSQARAEREFAERRLDHVEASLHATEDRLQSFLERNRTYRNSPALTFQQERLVRDVELQRQLRASLAQVLEQAKIDEVRDTPVFTILEPPTEPPLPDPRRRARWGLLALVGGMTAGVLLAYGVSYLQQGSPGAEHDVRRLLRETGADLVRPWRLLFGRTAKRGHEGIE
jgi:uncharacterized protein involved in exopolysaccharide biosynthesis